MLVRLNKNVYTLSINKDNNLFKQLMMLDNSLSDMWQIKMSQI